MSELDASSRQWPDLIARIRARTPARVLADRAGAAYRTAMQLELRQAHASARDAVRNEFDLERDLGAEVVNRWSMFEVCSQARSKDEYLLRPDLGRKLSQDGTRTVQARCPQHVDLQIVVGDGLSVTAVAAQVPHLLPLIAAEAKRREWKLGQAFAVRYCRVGLMNHIGELVHAGVVVLLIGERPGLATAESLSAYMAFQPRLGHSDAQRNLISNIHARGISAESAATRIVALAEQMIRSRFSGTALKEEIS